MTAPVVAWRRSILALVALTAAAACHRRPLPPLGAAAAERAPPRPAGGTPGFVGAWALEAADCNGRAWLLTTGGMQSPSVLSCSFDKINPTDAGYTVYSLCTVGKARAPGRLVFTLTGQGRSLTMNGGPFAEPLALVRCPRLSSAGAQAAAGVPTQGG
jgi:hypothetical protein